MMNTYHLHDGLVLLNKIKVVIHTYCCLAGDQKGRLVINRCGHSGCKKMLGNRWWSCCTIFLFLSFLLRNGYVENLLVRDRLIYYVSQGHSVGSKCWPLAVGNMMGWQRFSLKVFLGILRRGAQIRKWYSVESDSLSWRHVRTCAIVISKALCFSAAQQKSGVTSGKPTGWCRDKICLVFLFSIILLSEKAVVSLKIAARSLTMLPTI